MEWMRVALSAGLSGVGVCLATGLAGKVEGRWSGALAALPVTPTAGVLVLGSSVDAAAALRGLATVAAALLAILAIASFDVLRSRIGILLCLAAIAPVAFALDRLALPIVAVGAMTALAAARGMVRPPRVQRRSPGRMVWPVRFGIGAAAVFLVAGAETALPGSGVLLAMMPVLFVTTLVVVLGEHGPVTVHSMLPGGVAGTAGMIAFISVYAATWQRGLPSLAGLTFSWLAFVVTVWAWQALVLGPKTEPVRS